MIKDIKGKSRVDLVPYEAIESIARARGYGVEKYKEAWAWYDSGNPSDFVAAAIRHLYKWNDSKNLGNRSELDEESGLSHLDHALCSIAMAVTLEKKSS